jgi:DNA adenine methylase
MGKYNCEKCGKEFNQKSHYTTHINKKNPCVVESKIQEMIYDAIQAVTNQAVTNQAVTNQVVTNQAVTNQAVTNQVDINDINFNKLVKEVNHQKIQIVKPILKWVGGKTQIMDKLIVEFPTEINNYHEIFLGGGSVLLTLLSYVKEGIIKVHGNIYAYDLNEPLIYIYKNIQSQHNELYDKLQVIITEFNECANGEVNRKPQTIDEAKLGKENYYYWTRSEYNKLSFNDKKTILGSAMFIFLNKTCFRGVFRVGPKGFNVPYGHYKNPEIINREHLEKIHDLIQGVIFECCDYNISLNDVKLNDYVYLDPPYAPETTTSFVGYTENGFSLDNHNNLFKLVHKLTETNKKMMLSNADVKLVRENFSTCVESEKYSISSILCRRAINSTNPEATAKEVIIKNY